MPRALVGVASLLWVTGCGSVGSAGSNADGGSDGPAAFDAGLLPPDASVATDSQADAAPARCNQPIAAGDCTGQLPRSCQELYAWGARTEGAYEIDPDGAGANAPFAAYCEMNARDQLGWTLLAKVHTANTDGVDEPRAWFVSQSNPEMLVTRTFIDNQPPASHGAYKFAPLAAASTLARFEIYAQLDVTQKATWYKVVPSAASLQSWFTANDTTGSKVCTDLALTLDCSNGTIAPEGGGGATLMNGMNLTPFGYTGLGPIHMRLNDDGSPAASGVCSNTLDNDMNKWKDSYSTHWGNGLLIWIN